MNALRVASNSGISGWNLAQATSFKRPSQKEQSPAPSGDRFEFTSASKSSKTQGHRESGSARETRAENTAYYDASGDQKARDKFYGDTSRFDSMSPSQLYDELSSLVHGSHSPLDYKPSNFLYPQVDRRPDGQLYDIYSGLGPKNSDDPSNGQGILREGSYNCEHVVPQSWFNKKPAPRGDLHHLYTSLIDCNSLRGNAQFNDDVDSGQMMTSCGIWDKGNNLFEPHAGKGEAARAVLYFMLRYPGEIGDRKSEYGPEDLPMLLQWHQESPPTEYEKHRNQWIEKLQGNRNPLIDFPELASKVDFSRGLGR